MDFDHTCIYTLLGEGNELSRFWWPWPYFQGHSSTLKCPKYGFHAFSSELVIGFDQTCIDTFLGGEDYTKFWWPWLRSQRHFEMSKIWFQFLIFWISDRILAKLAQIHCGRRGRLHQILVTLTLFWRSHRHIVMYEIGFPVDGFQPNMQDTLLRGGGEE